MINSNCTNCIHYIGDLKCAAFPLGIPNSILMDAEPHTEPLPDQIGDIVYEPMDDE